MHISFLHYQGYYMLKFLLIILIPVLVFSQNQTDFLEKLAQMESKGSYYVIGGSGNQYFGKYQFSNIVLREIGWGHITVSKFRCNKSIFPPSKQEEAMLLLLVVYERYLNKEIDKYSGKYFNGIYISKAGILAAVHATGFSQVRAYFKNSSTKTKLVEYYLKQFSEYSIT